MNTFSAAGLCCSICAQRQTEKRLLVRSTRLPTVTSSPCARLQVRLTRVVAGQGEHGGLSAWHSAWTTGTLPADVTQLQKAAMRQIADAIRHGPVAFSGGSLETGSVFGYDGGERAVLMSGELWRELSLLGHWIVDAVIVRWASLTERFAHRQAIDAGDVLPLLLARPAPERTTTLARQIFIADRKSVV